VPAERVERPATRAAGMRATGASVSSRRFPARAAGREDHAVRLGVSRRREQADRTGINGKKSMIPSGDLYHHRPATTEGICG
jgi:hypothetical protein